MKNKVHKGQEEIGKYALFIKNKSMAMVKDPQGQLLKIKAKIIQLGQAGIAQGRMILEYLLQIPSMDTIILFSVLSSWLVSAAIVINPTYALEKSCSKMRYCLYLYTTLAGEFVHCGRKNHRQKLSPLKFL